MTLEKEFWKHKPLREMTSEEWEALCDGCGICCMYKIEDEDTGEILLTNVACRFLDPEGITCRLYNTRFSAMPTCIKLTPSKVETLDWLPDSCAYRLVLQGKPLPDWHPLVSGNPDSVHQAGVSVRNKTISESDIDMDDLEDHILQAPKSLSKRNKKALR